MATLPELVADYGELAPAAVAHLQRLVGSWGILSDLCFADLLLLIPARRPAADGDDDPGRFVVIGQVRPTTNQTLHREDLLGRVMEESERPLVARTWRLGSVVEGEVAIPSRGELARQVCIPVRFEGAMVAVMTRESALAVARRPGELERVYVEVFDRLARMIANGEFPFPVEEEPGGDVPRVGDGVIVLDATGRVDYASPNAVNALHRMGMYSGVEGMRLDEAGLDQGAVNASYSTHLPATVEVSRAGSGGTDASVVLRCIPLLDRGTVTGALVLMLDVTELRRRDRLLLSKDAAIREVHHRVKNNLQTISSLLRLQARRLGEGEARKSLEESERRVRSIALVHEILSRDTTDQVDFSDILPSLVRMAEDLASGSGHLRVLYHGDAGPLPAAVATPLAVVLTELLQNAAQHAFPQLGLNGDPGAASEAGAGPFEVKVSLERADGELRIEVRDNGVGLPAGFSIENTSSLGLSIVRDLVRSQMGGTIVMRSERGTVVEVTAPVGTPPAPNGSL